jgi:anti-anti-sigma factor
VPVARSPAQFSYTDPGASRACTLAAGRRSFGWEATLGSSDLLTVDVDTRGDAVVASVRGELDLATVPVLRERLDSIASGPASPLVVDLSGVTFIGSAGLALLVDVHSHCREHGIELAVVASGSVVPRAIQVTALDQVFSVHTSLNAAIGDPT